MTLASRLPMGPAKQSDSSTAAALTTGRPKIVRDFAKPFSDEAVERILVAVGPKFTSKEINRARFARVLGACSQDYMFLVTWHSGRRRSQERNELLLKLCSHVEAVQACLEQTQRFYVPNNLIRRSTIDGLNQLLKSARQDIAKYDQLIMGYRKSYAKKARRM